MWNLPPPPGFRGFDAAGKVRIYHRHLPHWRQDGVTYFVTSRLSDSLPKGRVRELAAMKEAWERRYPEPRSDAAWELLSLALMRRIERWLDDSFGSCLLRDSSAAQLVSESLHFFDDNRYELGCYVIMPNHAHLLVRPYSDEDCPLEAILRNWKSFTSRRLPRPSTCQQRLWQQESFDRIVRDEEHLHRCVQYIGNNPAKAKLTSG